MSITPQPGIMDIALYVGGQSKLEGHSSPLKLSSNENPYGPSRHAVAALEGSAATLHLYPPTDHADLRAAIAEIHGLDAERIICGAGSDEVLQFLAQCYAGPGDEVIHTEHGFAMYPILARAAGATPVEVRERDRVVDTDAILAACTERTRLIYLTNPGNPTGTMIPVEAVARLADAIPDHVILVLDGAYVEFAEGYDGGAKLVESRNNVVMTRTFSKIHGLGGLRIGWGYGPREIIDVLNRVRQPFNLSNSQLAAAEAAIRDTGFTEHCRSENARLRVWLRDKLLDLGIACDESQANYVLARFADEEEAAGCDAALRAEGILVRRVGGYGFPEALRITVGDEAGCARVIDAIARFKGAA
ncbi:histidinol-phosphate aminotransferase [Limimaricola soesokkakensis]|uniref:Histidinol-phosphate aminotransferase n=1 Tax=Limimaricola soesokkakensis TaxID=1343159 RepID=A0A1X6Z904_9RHOB|nr:histidinol-phosphate transaminase [Limimaricola soesokkakensis]PSK86703.1 histidinol-phosphate aminotransferase [Limimaricola soesokkakensis]SLN42345.1 Histidinol-phosphate aminotransferase 2 [Limimaricola soesokkakensis]